MGYFEIEDNYYLNSHYDENYIYMLTELGYQSAQQEEFYDNRRGILRLYITNNEFVPQNIVKITELRDDSYKNDETELIYTNNTVLNRIKNTQNILNLNNGNFILDSFEEKCRILKEETKQLIIDTQEKYSKITLLDFKGYLEEGTNEITNSLLSNEFHSDYNEKDSILFVEYNKDNLSLVRSVEIKEPKLYQTKFDKITLSSIKVSPKNLNDAKKWYKDLLVEQVNEYFFTDKDFMNLANNIASRFDLFETKLKGSITRNELSKKLNDKEDFYTKAKLETIDYLNY